jgi:hypothetical protein
MSFWIERPDAIEGTARPNKRRAAQPQPSQFRRKKKVPIAAKAGLLALLRMSVEDETA